MSNTNSLEIIIPMAGLGTRFTNAGYTVAKPFIQINERMMIDYVLSGLAIENSTATMIIQKSHETEYKSQLELLRDKYDIRWTCVEGQTAGAACTALAARDIIQDTEKPVLFADCDSIYQSQNLIDLIDDAQNRKLDGSLLTFQSKSDSFSYVRLDQNMLAEALQEKRVISKHAIAGVYYFSSYEMFEDNVIQMLIYGDTVKQEFYMSQVYNYLLKSQRRIGIWEINNRDFSCVGTPTQLETFLKRKNTH